MTQVTSRHASRAVGYRAPMTDLRALVLNCTLKPSPAESSTEVLGTELMGELGRHGVTSEMVRVVDHDVRFGISPDEGDGDAWPGIRRQMLDADLLVLVTPIWLGQPSAVCKMVLERLNAELSETDEQGRMSTYGKVATVGVVGNEDGAHHITAILYQALNDVGFTIPAQGGTYWNGQAMHTVDYKDLDETPEPTASATATSTANAAHLARLLRGHAYPAV